VHDSDWPIDGLGLEVKAQYRRRLFEHLGERAPNFADSNNQGCRFHFQAS
jgi:hypothetical protein